MIGRAIWRRLLVFAVFLIAGPPVGLVIVFAVSAAMNVYAGKQINLISSSVPLGTQLSVLMMFAGFAYLIGGVQAAFTGLAAAITLTRRGFVRILPVVATALAAAVVAGLVGKGKPGGIEGWALILALHAGSAFLCYLLANLLLRPFRNRQNESA